MAFLHRRISRRGRLLALATAAVALLLFVSPAAPSSRAGSTGLVAFKDAIVTKPSTVALQAAASVWGGTYTTSSGEQVRVFSSNAYPVDESRNQLWAEFLSKLVHGSELSTVTLELATPFEVQRFCGRGAVACYDPSDKTIYASTERVAADVSAEGVIAHEYGHHVAASRSNAPWDALDWGTKRWASYANICAGTEAGQLYPGDERASYQLNPGEAFAEVYRVLNERKLGLAESAWTIVDDRFRPDATALSLVEQDVLSPWLATSSLSSTGRVARRATKSVAVKTTLDGRLTATLKSSTRIRAELLVGGNVVSTKSGKSVTFATTVCGSRNATVRVRAAAAAAKYTLAVARP